LGAVLTRTQSVEDTGSDGQEADEYEAYTDDSGWDSSAELTDRIIKTVPNQTAGKDANPDQQPREQFL
jgi:hypothetical protein